MNQTNKRNELKLKLFLILKLELYCNLEKIIFSSNAFSRLNKIVLFLKSAGRRTNRSLCPEQMDDNGAKLTMCKHEQDEQENDDNMDHSNQDRHDQAHSVNILGHNSANIQSLLYLSYKPNRFPVIRNSN
ncbi:hypothetical protein BpHYR1_000135 [Brachionus plicatilis]|uniref:Uncharacterized protein n=1 Tax=Brachionus plicatilis TaxID=10195 RepID=A0A3M7SDN4_BRAPC|nr:hypothetical protein BpHYR1_000135 [Brachionus plicatilis]